MQNAGIGRLVQFGIILVLAVAHLTSQAQNNFEWKDASGKTRNLSDLQEILRKHSVWLNSLGASGTQASLAGAKLGGANLSEADLSEADLTGADLIDANLSGADLTGADLSDADLTNADLGRALLQPKSLPE